MCYPNSPINCGRGCGLGTKGICFDEKDRPLWMGIPRKGRAEIKWDD